MLNIWTAIQSRFLSDEEGASLVEYALLVALIAIAAIVGVTQLGTAVNTEFTDLSTNL